MTEHYDKNNAGWPGFQELYGHLKGGMSPSEQALDAELAAARQEIERLRPDAEKWRRMIERMVVRPAQPIETEEP